MIKILQKEWQNVIQKSLFEFPTIKESTIASHMTTIDDVVPEIQKNDIGLTRGERSKSQLKLQASRSSLQRVKSSPQKLHGDRLHSKSTCKQESEVVPSYLRKTASSKLKEVDHDRAEAFGSQDGRRNINICTSFNTTSLLEEGYRKCQIDYL